VTEPQADIRCMLIPLRVSRLLVPSTTVAEVIGYREPERIAKAPPWLEGRVNWQQRDVPVVDFERFMGRSDVVAGIRQRIVVCYALDAGSGWPVFGLVAQGIPRLLRVNHEVIEAARGGIPGDSAVRMMLSVADDEFVVPDLDYLQARLSAA
jgi:chemosensory pili system protein ChpC